MNPKNNEKKNRARAVALRYDVKLDKAPVVVSKGSGKIAEKILKLAEEHGIPIKQDKELAAILMKLDILEVIPENLYTVVAEILCFVYKLNQQRQKKGLLQA